MRHPYNTQYEALIGFKSDCTFTDLAENLIDDLFYAYGEEVLNFYLCDTDSDINLHDMKNIKEKIEEDFIISVCPTEDIKSDKIKLYELFPNSQYLVRGVYPEDDIIEILIKSEWINVFKIWEYPRRSWWIVEKSLFFKGCQWSRCPKPIQDHFIKLKECK